MKPMLAEDWDEQKVVFPVGIQPKIDGVRGLTTEGGLTGRSLKAHENRYTTAFFSKPEYRFMDGELAAEDERHPDLCRITSSAVSRIDGSPFVLWHVFDLLTIEAISQPYGVRYDMLVKHVHMLQTQGFAGHLRVVPMNIVSNLDELERIHLEHLTLGYEGSILRGLDKMHKQGRSSPKQQGLLRIKDFIDFEFRVTSITEGKHNGNDAQTNELGHTFRSTHQDNMVPNGMVGNLIGNVIGDVFDPQNKAKKLLSDGQEVTVSAGRMPHNKRLHYLANPSEIINHICKAQFFPKGIKDKPRFPTYTSHRSERDMSE